MRGIFLYSPSAPLKKMLKCLFPAYALAILAISGAVMGAPFRPADPATVLERLPYRPADPHVRELARLRAQLALQPDNLRLAVQLAYRYYQLVSAEGDPRYIGYAQAALQPWWTMPSPPPEVLVLRASLKHGARALRRGEKCVPIDAKGGPTPPRVPGHGKTTP